MSSQALNFGLISSVSEDSNSNNGDNGQQKKKKRPRKLRVFAKTVRLTQSGVLNQIFRQSLGDVDVPGVRIATEWLPVCVASLEKTVGSKVKWAYLKKEAHPAGPLIHAAPGSDWHWCLFVVFMEKILSIHSAQLTICGINSHLSPRNRRHVENVEHLVCSFPLFSFCNTVKTRCNCS